MSAETHSDCEIILGLLEQGTTACFKAGGPSMFPVIHNGDPVQVRPLCADDFRPGAVLLGHCHGRLMLHRLVRQTADALLLAGDAGLLGEDRVDPGAIVGVAVSVERAGRTRALDTRAHRFCGMLRYRLRPLRRLLGKMIEMLKI